MVGINHNLAVAFPTIFNFIFSHGVREKIEYLAILLCGS